MKEVQMKVSKEPVEQDAPVNKQDMGAQMLQYQRENEALVNRLQEVTNQYNRLATSNTLTFIKLMIEFLEVAGIEENRDFVEAKVVEFIKRETNDSGQADSQ